MKIHIHARIISPVKFTFAPNSLISTRIFFQVRAGFKIKPRFCFTPSAQRSRIGPRLGKMSRSGSGCRVLESRWISGFHPMRIGPFTLQNNLLLAPMAGVSDLPFRKLCRSMGAGLAVTEMVSSRPELRRNRRTLLKSSHEGETGPVSVQIVGADPQQLADAARYNADQGADIIDINMGCPAKKVCNTAAGSALLRDEKLVRHILEAVVAAVDVPVTLKIRTGWDTANRNAVKIAWIAECSGIRALSVHGRTRACGFSGTAEYETIREVKRCVRIPVVANGDIDSPQKAESVLKFTGADGIMIGRGAQGRPWVFREISEYLQSGKLPDPVSDQELYRTLTGHLQALYGFYGAETGVRIARKHIAWYLKKNRPLAVDHLRTINRAETEKQQMQCLQALIQQSNQSIAA